MPKTRRFVAATAIAAALLALSGSAVPAAPGGFGQIAGVGSASGDGCTGPFTLAGVASGSSWSFTVAFAGAATSLCVAGGIPVASGTWNPAAGGCLTGGAGTVCVGKVLATNVPVTVAVSFCIPAAACYAGTATVVRL